MYSDKRVLLIAGGGTLGTYVAEELLRLGATVEIICPEEKVADHPRLIFHRSWATDEMLRGLFAAKHYDGIVNFLHYENAEDYRKIHPLLISNTDHLIFLSSYRVYADEEHPITEDSPRLTEVVTDPDFLENEKYAVPKSKCEDYLNTERRGEPWTIVRPVISFSERRLDLLLYSGDRVVRAAASGEELLLPAMVKDFHAGLDWAGNSGKLMARLLFKEEAMGETFTVYSGHGLTWGEVAEIYQRRIGLKLLWCDEAEYLAFHTSLHASKGRMWMWTCDRRFNRDIDCSKILRVTGLEAADFATVEEGIRRELQRLKNRS